MINRKLAVFLPIALGMSIAGAAHASPFNGLYIGAQVGYSVYDSRISSTGLNVDGLSGPGAEGGLYAGWGMLFTPNYYGGIEAEYNWSGSQTTLNISDTSGTVNGKIKDKDNYGVGVRLGWLPNSDTMLYTRLGWQRVRLETSGSGNISGLGAFSGSSSVDHDGFRLGFGVEMAMTSNWLVRADYDHTWYNSKDGLEPNNDVFRVGLPYQF